MLTFPKTALDSPAEPQPEPQRKQSAEPQCKQSAEPQPAEPQPAGPPLRPVLQQPLEKEVFVPRIFRESVAESFCGHAAKARRWSGTFSRLFPYRFMFVYRSEGAGAAADLLGAPLAALQVDGRPASPQEQLVELRRRLAPVERRLQRVYVAKYNGFVRRLRDGTAPRRALFPLIARAMRGDPGAAAAALHEVAEHYLIAMFVWVALRLPFAENFMHWVLHELHHKPKHPQRDRLVLLVDLYYGVVPLDMVYSTVTCSCMATADTPSALAALELAIAAEGKRYVPKAGWTELLEEIKIEL